MTQPKAPEMPIELKEQGTRLAIEYGLGEVDSCHRVDFYAGWKSNYQNLVALGWQPPEIMETKKAGRPMLTEEIKIDHSVVEFLGSFSDPLSIRAKALSMEFAPLPLQGVEFYRFAPLEGHLMDQEQIRFLGLNGMTHVGSAFRLTLPSDPPNPTYIHSDFRIGKKTVITYLNPDPPADSGTSFWEYQMPSLARASEQLDAEILERLDADSFNVERWNYSFMVEGTFNKTVVFDSQLFHATEPQRGFGSTTSDGRLILVSFFI